MYFRKTIFAMSIGIVVLGVGIAAVWSYTVSPRQYSIVQFSNGQLYVGKLNHFLRLRLTDAYAFRVIQDEKNPGKNSFQLAPLRETLWAPQILYLQKNQIMFYGPLEETSKIVQGLRGQQ